MSSVQTKKVKHGKHQVTDQAHWHQPKGCATGDKAAATAALALASKKLDKAVSKGVLHKNNAANRKSALAKKVAAL
ncbi:MAG: hypothetical protein RJA60_278 [Actinomycetota bacterium]